MRLIKGGYSFVLKVSVLNAEQRGNEVNAAGGEQSRAIRAEICMNCIINFYTIYKQTY